MKRRAPLRRTELKRGTKPLRRGKPLRKRNPERLARLRSVQFGAQAALCRTLPCCVPGCGKGPPAYPSDPAHMVSRGAGGDDSSCVPLCRVHHIRQHVLGIRTFQERYGFDVAEVLAEVKAMLSDDCRDCGICMGCRAELGEE